MEGDDNNKLGHSGMSKKSYWIVAVIFVGVVLVAFGGYFIWNMSVEGELEASLASTMRGLTSLFIQSDDGQKEIISFQSQKDAISPSQSAATSSPSEDILPVAPSLEAKTKSKTENNNSAKLTPPTQTTTPPRVFISELTSGIKSSTDDEFIEIYNPTGQVIDLSGLYIKRKATSSSTAGNLISKSSGIFNGHSIAPHGFFLVASKAYSGNIAADVFYSQNTIFLADNGDVVTLYDKTDNMVDEISYSALTRGKSWERKAIIGGSCVSPQGAGELLGNGCDTGGADDFVIRDIPNPQNSGSNPEM